MVPLRDASGPPVHHEPSSIMLIAIIGNPGKPDLPNAVRTLLEILDERAIPVLLYEGIRAELGGIGAGRRFGSYAEIRANATYAIAFGGDGTMLAASRMLPGSGVPLLGVNLGKLGFLAEFSLATLADTIDELLAGECRIVERMLLQATFPDLPEQEPLIALNDIVFDKRGAGLMMQMETFINGDFLGAYRADGLILATPTGSTAYSLAVGGPVVVPSAQVIVMAPIAPHMLTARPVVVPDTAMIEVRPIAQHEGETATIIADGQVYRNLPMPLRVCITRHQQTAALVKSSATTYFDVLRAKLLWGEEVRTVRHGSQP
ncbi:MAG: NAD(+) kinase [Chlorobi bacterium CHB2]|nr:NAD(+) kinase [Chlorobi bacterium CHB2]